MRSNLRRTSTLATTPNRNSPFQSTLVGANPYIYIENLSTYIGSGGNVIIPATYNGWPITSIGNGTFENKAVTSVLIPGCVTNIGQFAFEDCYALKTVNIPPGVTSIANNTFTSCTNLTSITLPSTVGSIGTAAFSGCTGLTIFKHSGKRH